MKPSGQIWRQWRAGAALAGLAAFAIGPSPTMAGAESPGGATATAPVAKPATPDQVAAFATQLAAATGIKLVKIAAGTFVMGSMAGPGVSFEDEVPSTKVTLTKDFYLGATDVTQGQYQAVVGTNPSSFKSAGTDAPVESLTWAEAVAFCKILTERERAAGRLPESMAFALPTEAQWEYACRAGTTGPTAGDLDLMAWYDQNSGKTTHPVGQKQPNAWGLYDMNGNVWQWCSDWYGLYPGNAATDPTGPETGVGHIGRGGGWCDGTELCRSATRFYISPELRLNFLGVRVALVATAK
jgi:formylglycine-generating enzyme required for sulfatase activity